MNRNAMAGTFQASLNNLGGRAQILEQMYNHKAGIVNAKPQINNSEPFRLYNDIHTSQSVQSNKKLSPNHSSSKNKYHDLKSTSSIQQLIDYQKRTLQYNPSDRNTNTDCSDYNPYHIDSCATLRKNSASINMNSREKLRNASALQQIIRSAHVSPIRRGREQIQNDVNHQLNLDAQRKRISNIGSINERKKNYSDATVYPSLIQRSQRSNTLVDYYDTKLLQSPSVEKIKEEKREKKEKKKRKKSKRKGSKKNKKSKSPNRSVELNGGESKMTRNFSNSPEKSYSQDASNFYIAPPQSQKIPNPYNPNQGYYQQNYLQNTFSQLHPFSPSQMQGSTQSLLFHSINMSRDYEMFDYVHDIPFVRTFNYDELRIRLIFSSDELNDLFAKTQLKNNHLDNTKLNQVFDQIGKDIIKRQ